MDPALAGLLSHYEAKLGHPPRPPVLIKSLPRVAPEPISSGLSFRKLPEATLEQVIKCCQHYEAKCSGHYSASSPAARFLFDLSREVQDLLGLIRDRSIERDRRVKQLENLVREWVAQFSDPSPSLAKAGITATHNAPKQVADRVVELARLVEDLTRQRDLQTAHYDKEMEQLRKSMKSASRAAQDTFAFESAQMQRRMAEEAAQLQSARAALETEKAALESSFPARVEGEVTARLEAATAQTCADALAARREAEQRAAAAEGKAKAAVAMAAELQAVIDRERGKVKEQTSQYTQVVTELTSRLEQASKERIVELEQVQKVSEERIQEVKVEHQTRLEAERIIALESHCQWLANRVTQLQQLVDALQRGLAGRYVTIAAK